MTSPAYSPSIHKISPSPAISTGPAQPQVQYTPDSPAYHLANQNTFYNINSPVYQYNSGVQQDDRDDGKLSSISDVEEEGSDVDEKEDKPVEEGKL